MKRKVIVLLILIPVLLGLLLTCKSQSEQYIGEFKQCIPDIKTFINDNEAVFMELRTLFVDNEDMRTYFLRDATKNYNIIIQKYDVDTETYLERSFDDSSFFSEEEKNLIRKVFTFSSRNVNIYRISDGGDCYDFTGKNLVRMELVYDRGNSIIVEQRKDFSAYWEEILDNWYVFIIVSKPA